MRTHGGSINRPSSIFGEQNTKEEKRISLEEINAADADIIHVNLQQKLPDQPGVDYQWLEGKTSPRWMINANLGFFALKRFVYTVDE